MVRNRPLEMIKSSTKTGQIEIEANAIQLLNSTSDHLPLPYHRAMVDVCSEEIRLKYRYLELRQPYLQRNIRMRSLAMRSLRDFLISRDFCEIETPTLFRKTSEGAREYIVPTRMKNKFFTLTQSPQQYKQLLMVAGFDRYFQIARCYRDEDLRADRQPEFTQIDMEFAFAKPETIMTVVEGLVSEVWKKCLSITIPTPFPRHAYQWCMDTYGSDKPDTRFDLRLHHVTEIFSKTQIVRFKSIAALINHSHQERSPSPQYTIQAINLKKMGKMGEKQMDALYSQVSIIASSEIAKDVVVWQINANGVWSGAMSKALSDEEKDSLKTEMNIEGGDVIVICMGKGNHPKKMLGKVRTWAKELLIQRQVLDIPSDRFDCFWVVDFPLFEQVEDEQELINVNKVNHDLESCSQLASTHHPFTAPIHEDLALLETQPHKVIGQHYDLVINGYEIGGGSIRIHQQALQLKVLRDVLKLSLEKIDEFKHLTDALGYGCPPHGGIALGFDRMMAILVGAKSLRDVIAFPKSGSGCELMTGAPSELDQGELNELITRLENGKVSDEGH